MHCIAKRYWNTLQLAVLVILFSQASVWLLNYVIYELWRIKYRKSWKTISSINVIESYFLMYAECFIIWWRNKFIKLSKIRYKFNYNFDKSRFFKLDVVILCSSMISLSIQNKIQPLWIPCQYIYISLPRTLSKYLKTEISVWARYGEYKGCGSNYKPTSLVTHSL